MAEEKPKPIEGEIFSPEASVPAPPSGGAGVGLMSTLNARMQLFALRKAVEAETAFEAANAALNTAIAERARTTEEATVALARISKKNLKKTAKRAGLDVVAELSEAEERLATAKAGVVESNNRMAAAFAQQTRENLQNELDRLELELKIAETQAKLDKFNKPKPSYEEEARALDKEFMQFQEEVETAQREAGGKFDDMSKAKQSYFNDWFRKITEKRDQLAKKMKEEE